MATIAMPWVTKGAAVCWVFVVWVVLLCVCVYVFGGTGKQHGLATSMTPFFDLLLFNLQCQTLRPEPIQKEATIARWMAGSFLMPWVTKGAAVCWVFVVWVVFFFVCVYVFVRCCLLWLTASGRAPPVGRGRRISSSRVVG